MISRPLGSGSATFSFLASHPAVMLWKTTVPMMMEKLRGTSREACSIPASSSFRANTAAIAAATIPLGPIQAINARSEKERLDPNVETATFSGRPMNCKTRNTPNAPQPRIMKADRSIRAASKINSAEIRMMLRVSLKSRISFTGTFFILAKTMPITVTANRPASSASILDSTKAASTMFRTSTL